MGTIVDQLNYLQQTKNLIRNAIETKGGTVSNTDTFRKYVDHINNLSLVSTVPQLEVKSDTAAAFFDYDGTILETFTKSELDSLERLPYLQDTAGGVCGWTKTLDTIKQEVAISGYTEVGQMFENPFSTYRNMAVLKVDIVDPSLTVQFDFVFNGMASNLIEANEKLTIVWGDGGSYSTLANHNTMSPTHTYTSAGSYEIRFYWETWLTGNEAAHPTPYSITVDLTKMPLVIKEIRYGDLVQFIHIGEQPLEKLLIYKSDNINSIDLSLYSKCYKLKALVLPTTVTSIVNGDDFIANKSNFAHLVLPNGITGDINLSGVGIESFYMTIGPTYAEYCFSGCERLKRVGLNDVGTYTFDGECVGHLPKGLLHSCRALEYVKVPSELSIGKGVFQYSNCAIIDFSEWETLPNRSKAWSDTFLNMSSKCKIKMSESAYNDYMEYSDKEYNHPAFYGFENQFIIV